jgi:uncharacterized protein (TIGR03435 family)
LIRGGTLVRTSGWLVTLLIVGTGLVWVGCQERPPTELMPYAPPPEPAPAPAPAAAPSPALVPPEPKRTVIGEVMIVPTSDPQSDAVVQISESTHTIWGVNLRMSDLISVAYRTPDSAHAQAPRLSSLRVVSREPLPAGRLDVRVMVPQGSAADLRAALRNNLSASFGYTVRREPRETNAYVLTAPRGQVMGIGATTAPPLPGPDRVVLSGDRLSLLAEQLEEWTREPVVDESGLKASYALELPRTLRNGQLVPVTVEAARTAVRQQLGLDLTPARRTIEYLIVEHTTPTQR